MQALYDVVQAGWVRYVGMPNCCAWQFHVMQNHAINNDLTPFMSMQNDYNILYHEDKHEIKPTLNVRINRICDSLFDSQLQYLDVSFLSLITCSWCNDPCHLTSNSRGLLITCAFLLLFPASQFT
ncbi:hypothetical protein EDD18DRAFT_330284 [Armillaria luteobubalina]|uniref:Uncharacterized protein n=1 Tax=Armillaria luteobubalina TaxID=153913 RepID=A0AA39QNX9_9AGAR|nr:hypothetical protein EDD18DRAFT_330284 [Armillaria luteobubalina]